MTDLPAYVTTHQPRCIALVQALPVAPIEKRGADSAAFRLLSRAGQEAARVFGHRLSTLNPDYRGAEFVSPLLLVFAEEGSATLIFDSDLHGYHGEMGASAKLRGQGTPETYACPDCSGDQFTVSVQFDYDAACHDLAQDDPDLPVQDYFRNILVQGRCVRCGRGSTVLDMDL